MKTSSFLRAGCALSLSLILISCTGATRQAQIDAAQRLGRASAGIVMERQADECGRRWPDLPGRVGEDARSLAKRYIDYVRGPINDRQGRCYAFNEQQYLGLTGQ